MSWSLVSCLARTAAAARAAGEPVVWAPEMMAGIWRSPGEVVDYPDPTPEEEAAWWGAALALGYQGFNFYMLVDRENWQFAPISAVGDLGRFSVPLRRLVEGVAACPELLEARPEAGVTGAVHRPDLLGAHTTGGAMRQPVVPWAGPARPGADRHSGGCSVVRVPGGIGVGSLPEVRPSVRVLEHDPAFEVLAAVHATPDGGRLLHLVQWGGSGLPAEGRLEISGDRSAGVWREVLSGAALRPRPDGGWVLLSFVGHLVCRWEGPERV